MKRLFLGSVLVALGLGTPFAAASCLPRPPAPAAAHVYANWSGCYVGASAGTSSGHTDGFITNNGPTVLGTGGLVAGSQLSNDFNLSGFIGGGTLGCNWQAGAWVFGIEGDGSATNKSGQAFSAIAHTTTFGDRPFELQERWLVTARGRLGLTNFGWLDPIRCCTSRAAARGRRSTARSGSPTFPKTPAPCSPIRVAVGRSVVASNTHWVTAGPRRASSSTLTSATGTRSPVARAW